MSAKRFEDLEVWINAKDFNELNEQITQVSKMLSGFMNYLKQSELKGSKYIESQPLNFES